jgi:hypothetical protein
MSNTCPGTAHCDCGRIYPCPLPQGHDTQHPTRLDECHHCRQHADQRGPGRPPTVSTATT